VGVTGATETAGAGTVAGCAHSSTPLSGVESTQGVAAGAVTTTSEIPATSGVAGAGVATGSEPHATKRLSNENIYFLLLN
jgi:hypothetical protein